MKSFGGYSYCLMLALIFFVVATRRYAFAEEKCSGNNNADTGKRLLDQSFGMPLTADDILTSMMGPMMSPMMSPWLIQDYFRPWRHLAALSKDLGSTIKSDKDKFQINLDVQHFSPEEITVKTADGYVVVEAKHEEKKDEHGFVSRQFVRKYALPKGTETENVVSELSSDGILTVSAPRKIVDDKGERTVPITKTGPVRQEPKSDDSQGTCEAPDKCNV